MTRILLAGGGTAGHVNPLLATASVLQGHGIAAEQLVALGTTAGLETKLVPQAGLRLETIEKVPAPRRPNKAALAFPARWLRAQRQAHEILVREQVDVVVGFGGYVSTPAYRAARKLGLPVVIHEQNARPGLANRYGARFAHTVAVTFPSTPLRARQGHTEVIGLPLRAAVAELARARAAGRGQEQRAAGAAALGLDPSRPILVVTGGSLGAKRLNDAFAAGAAHLAQVQVLHLTGRGKDAEVRQATSAFPDYHVLDYLGQMEAALACADLVVCRAGAGTVSELAALGVPAIYVPLPIGNGEQRLNAADVVAVGGAELVPDAEVGDAFVARVAELVLDSEKLSRMGQAAAQVGRVDAAERLAELVLAAADRGATARASRPSFHFIGLGGAGMSVIAELLHAQGAQVSGSDRAASATLRRLQQLGITGHVGHAADQVPPGARVVVSSAVRPDNPELRVARERGQEVLHRSEALALAARDARFVAVAGAHGKTTTSAMTAFAARATGLDPSWAVGASITGLGSGAHLGAGDIFVAEADESDGSFLNYRPAVAIVTNIEPDHLDHYGSREAFEQAFADFAQRIAPGGALVACADDAGVARLLEQLGGQEQAPRLVSYGFGPAPAAAATHYQLVRRQAGYALTQGTQQWELRLALPGDHLALDAAAAVAALVELGGQAAAVVAALADFAGTGRRFELRGEVGGVRVVDDYAHHPTEVAATLRTARAVCSGQVRVLFQPHLYSRTVNFQREFAAALAQADDVVVTDIYAAREDPVPGVDGRTITQHGTGEYVADKVAAARLLAARSQPGDLLLTVGAGDITELADVMLAALAQAEQ
ncbi:UDP-N-acetylmuramate--L-alanine ligase [Buchananella hordeovulneris]|uniref:UDP-N-acetylmuramate--L-alanine ligase n=1 Tax=Buchananella hordeovulneris TaxID=52770 RepID=UPI000F5E423C|nr:UDP-N-acetylmuramate--L-alanine ligase [Buchananella hordeovulneris]RRD53645.1 UDP-N-acetylmuramate--L-alanine ligase [Buchananella hordeovulneris]